MVRSLPLLETRASKLASLPPLADDFAPPTVLADALGRRYTYLRLSVTDRCDLRCIYCMPEQGEWEHGARKELLDFDEIERLVGLLAERGVQRVRLTGGEPMIRKELPSLIGRLSKLRGITEVVMTTNATRLATFAAPLVEAGLRGVNVSLDSLQAEKFATLTRGGDLRSVLQGIEIALTQGLRVKLNTVVIGGQNDDEVEEIVRFAWQLGITPRFIELMPLGEGAHAGSVVPSAALEHQLKHVLCPDASPSPPHRGPARYRVAADGSGHKVGFISAVSQNFCGSCNRLRVTAKGELRACLASRAALSFRDLMREGADDRQILWALSHALSVKSDGHLFNDPDVTEHERVGMSLIGG